MTKEQSRFSDIDFAIRVNLKTSTCINELQLVIIIYGQVELETVSTAALDAFKGIEAKRSEC